MLTPFCKMYGHYFDPNPEPQDWDTNFKALFDEYFKGTRKLIYPLEYFYDSEDDTFKRLKYMDNALKFVRDDPYNKYDEYEPNVENNIFNVKRIGIKRHDSDKEISTNKLREEKKVIKKKRGRKKKVEKKRRVIHVKRINKGDLNK